MKDNLIIAAGMAMTTFVFLSVVLGLVYASVWLANFLGQYSPWLVASFLIMLFSAVMGVFTLMLAPGDDEIDEDPPAS